MERSSCHTRRHGLHGAYIFKPLLLPPPNKVAASKLSLLSFKFEPLPLYQSNFRYHKSHSVLSAMKFPVTTFLLCIAARYEVNLKLVF